MEDINERGIYTDLVRELARRGINMYVVSPRERRTNLKTELTIVNNIKLLKVKTGNITETSFLEKGLSTLTIESQFLTAVKKYFANIQFDMVMYSTPPITFEKVVRFFKKEHKSMTYLILKDIFPQNAVDLRLIKKGGFVWRYFRYKEKKLYEASDVIGCMSQGNVDYILAHNSFINKRRVEVFPNSIEPIEMNTDKEKEIYEKFNIPRDSTLFVYGGNLGKPQGIDFLLKVAEHFHKVDRGYLLIVGSGTEYEIIRNYINSKLPTNVSLFSKLPKNDFDSLLSIADVGLIFLDHRFTIPNIPSRLTSYMEQGIPILAATDKHTDLKDILAHSESGLWSESGEIDLFIENAKKLSLDKPLREKMGQSGRWYLEENYDVRNTANIILKHFN